MAKQKNKAVVLYILFLFPHNIYIAFSCHLYVLYTVRTAFIWSHIQCCQRAEYLHSMVNIYMFTNEWDATID